MEIFKGQIADLNVEIYLDINRCAVLTVPGYTEAPP